MKCERAGKLAKVKRFKEIQVLLLLLDERAQNKELPHAEIALPSNLNNQCVCVVCIKSAQQCSLQLMLISAVRFSHSTVIAPFDL
jgi:hypothetical protein